MLVGTTNCSGSKPESLNHRRFGTQRSLQLNLLWLKASCLADKTLPPNLIEEEAKRQVVCGGGGKEGHTVVRCWFAGLSETDGS